MSESFENQREFTRVPAHLWGMFDGENGERITCELENISMRGCHARADENPGTPEAFRLQLTTDLDPDSLALDVEARVVRRDATGMGIEFVEMPLETYEHLQRLLELHAPDPNRIAREVRNHRGLRRAG